MSNDWLLYGANGYTAELVLELVNARGLHPILAGRREESIRPIAERLGLTFRTFALDDPAAVKKGIEGVRVVVNLAGPYSQTAKPMVEACLATGAHYLDITGEIDVFEWVIARRAEAERAGCVLISGVGFDVVPTDCLAKMLAEAMPDARELELAFAPFGPGGISRGTLKTMLENIGRGARVRVNGEIRAVPFDWRTPRIRFERGERSCVTLPWGDVSTAYHSTGVPNVCVYMAAPGSFARTMRILRPLIAPAPVHRALQWIVTRTMTGPDRAHREKAASGIWGRVTNAAGDTACATLTSPEGYTLTAESTLAALDRVLAGGVSPGAWTPSVAFGADFVRGLPDVHVSEIRRERRST
ncbi:MAG: saccharopine dehydrogenase NADP-binding domain-containing protein [Deltaproteobacteria bacterium]|nr:saccharopine dehydrogenase NADP-binding domain-containing protein [Deltaproteobacteria bacterium]